MLYFGMEEGRAMFLWIRNANVFAPESMGKCDILVCGDRIAAVGREEMGPGISHLCQVIDADGLTALPGLIDQHVHIIGGGGEDGLRSSIGDLTVEECVENGVTTLVGLLGTDSITKSVRRLATYAKYLNQSAITAYCLTGAYAYPPPTVTGSVQDDIVFINEMIGVKLAISDHRCFYPTRREILQLAAQARNGGLVSGKAGFVHLHLGKEKTGLKEIIRAVEETDFPIAQFRPTHVENHLEDAVRFAQMGGSIDFTAGNNPEQAAEAIHSALRHVPPERITASSDANGSLPNWGPCNELIGMHKSKISSLLRLLRALVRDQRLPLEQALPIFTTNVARGLGIGTTKGALRAGYSADLILLTPDLEIRDVIAKGRHVVRDGKSALPPYYTPDKPPAPTERRREP